MISKELLSEVLGIQVLNIDINESVVLIKHYVEIHQLSKWNIYELVHKCKEWAINQGYQFEIYIQCNTLCDIRLGKCGYGWDIITMLNMPEKEAIFKVCQWILDNKDKK